MDDALIGQYRRLSSSMVSDALDRLGRRGVVDGIRPITASGRHVGPAFTVGYRRRGSTSGSGTGTVGDYIDDVEPGSIVVLANEGRDDCSVWGGLLSAAAKQRNLAATVIDGRCRDVAVSTESGYPLYARGQTMRTGKDRADLASVGEPITVSGVVVNPGDLVIADDDGVVLVPAASAPEVARVAAQIDAAENEILEAVRSGTPLAEARRRVGYHDLQRNTASSHQRSASNETPGEPS